MKDNSPCIDCKPPVRHPGCHSRCQIGIAYSKRCKAQREAIKAARSREDMVTNYEAIRNTNHKVY